MTPPVRDAWTSFDAATYRDAWVLAEANARTFDRPFVVCLEVADGQIGFWVMLQSSYAELREQGRHDRMAVVLTVHPTGRIEQSEQFTIPTTR